MEHIRKDGVLSAVFCHTVSVAQVSKELEENGHIFAMASDADGISST